MIGRPALAALLAGLLACRPPPAGSTDAPTPAPAVAQTPEPTADAKRLQTLARRVDAERERLGIPGLALVIVRDGDVVLAQGFGARERGGKAEVDGDTLFAIGSATKAFTAMLVMMAVEAGHFALDDPPRKCLPELQLRDKTADAALRIRDLLTHTSGLMAMDLGWYTGQLDRAEVLRLVAQVEPVAQPHTVFQYHNVMYAAAGECAARAFGMDYDALLRARILDKIGMGGASTTVATMLASPDHATGHHRRADHGVEPVPMRDLDAVAPSGAINASATMMAGWLRTLLDGGRVETGRLLTPKGFAELLRPQFPAGPGIDYGLGWTIARHGKHTVVQHTGGTDGFSSLVALMPDRRIGFALLTNVDHSDIHGFVTHEVFALLDESTARGRPTVASRDEAGTYGLLGGFKVAIEARGESIAMRVPGQPTYALEHIDGRRYRLTEPAPAGFFATFRARKDEPNRTEILLEQPFGDLVLPRLTDDELALAAKAEPPAELRELLGIYRERGQSVDFELSVVDGRVALVVPGQPPTPLEPRERDRFALAGLPPGFDLQVRRDGKGRPSGLLLQQPNAVTELELVGSKAPPSLSIDQLLARRARAHGSARLAKHRTLVVESELVFVHQGLTGTSTTWREAPDRWAEDVRLVAFAREIGRIHSGFAGGAAFQAVSFAPDRALEPFEIDAARLEAAFDPWAANARPGTATIAGRSVLHDVPVVVVRFTTDWGATITDSLDAKTFVVRRRELALPTGTPAQMLHEVRDYGDYRRVGGVLVPHRVETESTNGKVVATVTRVRFDAPVPTDAFSRTSSGRSAAPTR